MVYFCNEGSFLGVFFLNLGEYILNVVADSNNFFVNDSEPFTRITMKILFKKPLIIRVTRVHKKRKMKNYLNVPLPFLKILRKEGLIYFSAVTALMQAAIQEFVSLLKPGVDIEKVRRMVAKKHHLQKWPSNIDVLEHLSPADRIKYQQFLLTKPVRTLSGVAPVAVMTKPIACAHGKCTFCAGGPGSVFGDVPQSYTGNEPSTMRAIRSQYDPYLIVMNRLEQYTLLNQVVEKTELIIQGGTFPSFDVAYQEEVIAGSLKAMNDFSALFFAKDVFAFEKFKEVFELPGTVKDRERTQRIQKKLLQMKGITQLEKEQQRNETAKIRCTAMVIETKPDWCKQAEIDAMLRLGTTRVELGVQTLKEHVLKSTNRGHTLADTKEAVQLLKDAFLKTTFHMMPGLPETTKEEDIQMFQELFANPAYRPDSLKIYPCLVMPGTPLFEQYKRGTFTPLSTEEAASIIAQGKKYVPGYCRIMRVNRDIPTKVTEAGVGKTNLRQDVEKEVRRLGIQCRCIRCREPKQMKSAAEDVQMKRYDYESSGGKEVFLAIEDVKEDMILGFCRLRLPFKPWRQEITAKSAGVRELHVYGKATALEEQGRVQHQGHGKRLMQEAERIAKEEWDCDKLLVIAGIGVREYYAKLGYARDGVYVAKLLKP